MATFSFNEDGTLNYIPERTPYSPNNFAKGASALADNNTRSRRAKKLVYDTKAKIGELIAEFERTVMPISESVAKKYLPKVNKRLRTYFLLQVIAHNEKMASLSTEEKVNMIINPKEYNIKQQ